MKIKISTKASKKDLNRKERCKKPQKKYMKSLKEDILNDNHISSSSFTNNFIPSTSSPTDNCTTRTSAAHIYKDAVMAVPAINACVFLP